MLPVAVSIKARNASRPTALSIRLTSIPSACGGPIRSTEAYCSGRHSTSILPGANATTCRTAENLPQRIADPCPAGDDRRWKILHPPVRAATRRQACPPFTAHAARCTSKARCRQTLHPSISVNALICRPFRGNCTALSNPRPLLEQILSKIFTLTTTGRDSTSTNSPTALANRRSARSLLLQAQEKDSVWRDCHVRIDRFYPRLAGT